MEHPASRSESIYEDVDPLDEISLPAGPIVRLLDPPGLVVVREPVAAAVPAVSSPIVHMKRKKIRIPSRNPPSSNDEDSLYADPLPGHFVVC